MASTQTTIPPSSYSQALVDALSQIVQAAVSPDALRAQRLLLERLALQGDVVPSRIPAPLNITEIGGYLNLLEHLRATEMRSQVLASVLGVAGPPAALDLASAGPVLYFAERDNDRPAGAAQAATPTRYLVRSDFAPSLAAALDVLHARGCRLPLQRPVMALPPPGAPAPGPAAMLRAIGRTLELVPAAALADPAADPLALARPTAGGPLQVVARQLDAAAASAALVAPADWTAWRCTAAACQEVALSAVAMQPLAPVLNAAGWYQPAPGAPATLLAAGSWHLWTNTTGLVAGATRYGDELQYLYPVPTIVASLLRERLDWLWNGTAFAAP